MARKVSFDDVELMERLFNQLSVEDAEGSSPCPFKEWELLHELDRQAHRREYDKSPERIKQRQELTAKRAQVRKYIADHPEVRIKMEAKIHGHTTKA